MSISPIARAESIPDEIREILGPPPLLSTEDAKLYEAMMGYFAQSIRPADLITWMLIKDLADHRIEIARYRRIKTGLIQLAVGTALKEHMDVAEKELRNGPAELRRKADQKIEAATKSKTAQAEIEAFKATVETELVADIRESQDRNRKLLEHWRAYQVSESDFVRLFARWIDKLPQIDVHLQAAEQRFSASLDEIDLHIYGLGRRLREDLDRIIEGEIVDPQARPRSGQVGDASGAKSALGRTAPFENADLAGRDRARANPLPLGRARQRPKKVRNSARVTP